MDKVTLKGISCLTKVGVYDWEREFGCPCEIDLDVGIDLRAAGNSDRLEDTIDYSRLHRQVVQLAGSCGFKLLERLAEEIASLVLGLPGVRNVRVAVRKTGIMGVAPLRYAGVEIYREHAAASDASS